MVRPAPTTITVAVAAKSFSAFFQAKSRGGNPSAFCYWISIKGEPPAIERPAAGEMKEKRCVNFLHELIIYLKRPLVKPLTESLSPVFFRCIYC